MVFKMKKIECLPDPQFVMNSVCVVKAVNWNKAVAQMDCDLIRPLRNLSVSKEQSISFRNELSCHHFSDSHPGLQTGL